MQKEQILTDLNTKEDKNVIDFATARLALSTGGTVSDENWLSNLPINTVFVSKRYDQPKDMLVCDLYCILEHKKVTSNLLLKTPDNRQLDVWFETLEFSRKNKCIEVIATVEFGYKDQGEPDDKEIDDGNSDRTV